MKISLVCSLHFCLFILSFSRLCLAQQSQFSIRQYNTDNGLPQNSVNSIQFDKLGYCWLATEMGLVRFDGKTFREFGNTEFLRISSYRIRKIAPSVDGGLFTTGPNDKKHQRISIETDVREKSSFPVLFEDSTINIPAVGFALKGNDIRGLDKILSQRNKTPHLPTAFVTIFKEIYLDNLGRLYYSKDANTTWLSMDQKLYRHGGVSTLVDDHLVHLYPGNLLAVWERGVFQPKKRSIKGEIERDPFFLSGNFQAFWCVNGTYLYCGKSLYRIYLQNDLLMSEKVLDELTIPNIVTIYYAIEQRKYYIGSKTEGLFVIEPSLFQYPQIPQAVSSQIFYPQAKTREDAIFSNDILFSSRIKSQYLPLKSKDGMVTYVTPSNEMYFEADFSLHKYDLNTHQNRRIMKLGERLRSIIPDGQKIIFFTRKSVGVLDADSVKLQKDLPKDIKVISALRLGREKFLLSTEAGLKWYNMKQNKFYHSVLDSLQVRTAMLDKSGRIWIASYGMGFYLYENGKIIRMPFGPRQALKTVHAFIDDGAGYFWLPTNNGLFRVRKDDLIGYANQKISDVYYYMFDKQNGLRTNEFNGGCDAPYVRLSDGMLSVSSINGLVWFYPDKIILRYPEKDIYLDELQINGKQVTLPSGEVSLDPDFESIALTVSCPYFGNRDNQYLKYRIEGLNTRWQPLPENGKIVVGRSRSGNYKIVVAGMSGKSVGFAKVFEFPFDVKPWFYETWWFYLLAISLLTVVAYLLVRKRIRDLKERAKKLEEIVKARTFELNQSIDDLAISEAELLKSTRVKDSIITLVLHDLRSPIGFISSVSSYLVRNYSTLDESLMRKKLEELESGAVALHDFTKQFFLWATSQHEDFKITKTKFGLQTLFDEITDLYGDISKSYSNELIVTQTNLKCYTDYQILALILRNLIDNANKNTLNGQILLSARSIEAEVLISVTDTGLGLTPDQIANFMDRFKGMGQNGLGSILISTMLDKINGKLEITSSVESGSTFTLILNNQ